MSEKSFFERLVSGFKKVVKPKSVSNSRFSPGEKQRKPRKPQKKAVNNESVRSIVKRLKQEEAHAVISIDKEARSVLALERYGYPSTLKEIMNPGGPYLENAEFFLNKIIRLYLDYLTIWFFANSSEPEQELRELYQKLPMLCLGLRQELNVPENLLIPPQVIADSSKNPNLPLFSRSFPILFKYFANGSNILEPEDVLQECRKKIVEKKMRISERASNKQKKGEGDIKEEILEDEQCNNILRILDDLVYESGNKGNPNTLSGGVVFNPYDLLYLFDYDLTMRKQNKSGLL